jgi:hypothetical protein
MMIETTAYLDRECIDLLAAMADDAGISRSKLVVLLLKRVMKDHAALVRYDCSVKYQERKPVIKRKRIHVGVELRDYEFFIDMRKLFKLSVSFLIAYAVKMHLEELLRKMSDPGYDEYADNYPYQHYFIIPEKVDSAICWKIYWGIPENPHKLFPA